MAGGSGVSVLLLSPSDSLQGSLQVLSFHFSFTSSCMKQDV